jgi:CheY-like chemotaxis protein
MAHVLLVDDDQAIRAAASRVLRSRGHLVEVAEHGVAALERLGRDPLPDVIVLDLSMPVMDGFAFRAAQVRDARLAKIPVVLSSGGAPAGRSGCLEGIVVTHKPVRADVLDDAIRTAISTVSVCSQGRTCAGCHLPTLKTGASVIRSQVWL